MTQKEKAIEFKKRLLRSVDGYCLTDLDMNDLIEIATKPVDCSEMGAMILKLANSNHHNEYGSNPTLEAFYNGKIELLFELASKNIISITPETV